MDQQSTTAGARFCVVDVETSGLTTRWHRVLQVAAVVVDADGVVLDAWSSLIRPRWRWTRFRVGPTHIHGITRHALRRAPHAADVAAELQRRLQGATFTAHNAEFDAGFIAALGRRARVALATTPQLCTLRLSRSLDPDRLLTHRLADLCVRYGVDNSRPHDALQDALATAAVLPHLLRAHGAVTDEQLRALTSAA